jgi:uncharacterized damage-inducible protein DinB
MEVTMSEHSREQRVVQLPSGYAPQIAPWIWGLEETRRRTRRAVEDLSRAALDWADPQGGNSIGSILYHTAAIEIDYLYADLLQAPFPADIVALFPYDVREEDGRLTPVLGFDLDWYLDRLDYTRAALLEVFRPMTVEEFRRVRHLADQPIDITPEWVLPHLIQHESTHRAEIEARRAQVKRADL